MTPPASGGWLFDFASYSWQNCDKCTYIQKGTTMHISYGFGIFILIAWILGIIARALLFVPYQLYKVYRVAMKKLIERKANNYNPDEKQQARKAVPGLFALTVTQIAQLPKGEPSYKRAAATVICYENLTRYALRRVKHHWRQREIWSLITSLLFAEYLYRSSRIERQRLAGLNERSSESIEDILGLLRMPYEKAKCRHLPEEYRKDAANVAERHLFALEYRLRVLYGDKVYHPDLLLAYSMLHQMRKVLNYEEDIFYLKAIHMIAVYDTAGRIKEIDRRVLATVLANLEIPSFEVLMQRCSEWRSEEEPM